MSAGFFTATTNANGLGFDAGLVKVNPKREQQSQHNQGDRILDPVAFQGLLDKHAAALKRVVATYEADPHLQEDLYQDIAIAIWRAMPNFRGEAGVKTFILRIAHNRGAGHVAKEVRVPRGAEPLVPLPDHQPTPEKRLIEAQSGPEVRLVKAIQKLPVNQRQIITLALEGTSYQDIAEILGISVSNVGVRLNRAKKALRAELGQNS